MNFLENIRLAWEGIRAGKMRAFLTMLGIIIGIASVIGILTLGDGLTNSINGEMSGLGATNIYLILQSKSTDREGGMRAYEDSDLLTEAMLDDLRERYASSIEYISLSQSVSSGKAKDGTRYANVSVTGVNPEYLDANAIDMIRGKGITAEEVEGNRMSAVVSDKFVNNMFDGNSQAALGSEIAVYTAFEIYTFRIIGVYKYEQNLMNMSMSAEEDIQTDVYIPLSTAKKLSGAAEGFSTAILTAKEGTNCANFAAVAANYLNRYYKNNQNFQITAISMESMLSTVDSMMSTLSIAISVIAGISLLVGGIGVMNIMLVSVTERTREIGTRKAIGATNGDIRIQFVTESVIICLIGGVLGVLLGALFGYLGSSLLKVPTLPGVEYIVLAVSFSMAIGVFFGYYPASKAAKLDPIEALRYE